MQHSVCLTRGYPEISRLASGGEFYPQSWDRNIALDPSGRREGHPERKNRIPGVSLSDGASYVLTPSAPPSTQILGKGARRRARPCEETSWVRTLPGAGDQSRAATKRERKGLSGTPVLIGSHQAAPASEIPSLSFPSSTWEHTHTHWKLQDYSVL